MPRFGRQFPALLLGWDLASLGLPCLAISTLFAAELAGHWTEPARRFLFIFWPIVLALGVWRLLQSLALRQKIGGVGASFVRFDQSGSHSSQLARGIRFVFAVSFVLIAQFVLWQGWSRATPWLGGMAMVLALCGWSLGRFPLLSWTTIVALGLLLLSALRLPTGTDQLLTNLWAATAGWLVEGVLDFMQVPNLRFADRFETAKVTLRLTEVIVGSGMWSGFAFLSLAALTIFLVKSSALGAVLKMLAAFCITFLLHGQLLFILVWQPLGFAGKETDSAAIAGWLFSLAFLQFLCLERLIAIFLRPPLVEVPELIASYHVLNQIVSWPQARETELPEEALDGKEVLGPIPASVNRAERGSGVLAWMCLITIAAFCLLNISTVFLRNKKPVNAGLEATGWTETQPTRDSLPIGCAGWTLERYIASPSGANALGSIQRLEWTYRKGGEIARFRIHKPSPSIDWANAGLRGEGWLEAGVEIRQRLTEKEFEPWLEAELKNASQGNAVLFATRYRSDEPHSLLQGPGPIEYWCNSPRPTAFEITLFCQTLAAMDSTGRQDLRDLYLELRRLLLSDLRSQNVFPVAK
jgi:hypothetical protein